MLSLILPRRSAIALISSSFWLGRSGLATEENTRKLNFEVANEFGQAPPSNVAAVLNSAAHEIWKHCESAKFQGTGFKIYRHQQYPITHFKHDDQQRIVIGLCTQDLYWAQYAYQFAHEFCHAVLDHTDERQQVWHGVKYTNHWLDETFCEAASLFALRAMSKSWEKKAPYSNWSGFAPKLASYAEDHLKRPEHRLPNDTSFGDWFAQELPTFRQNSTQRAKNTIVAAQLLPVFERDPAGWGTLPRLKTTPRDAERSLKEHLERWRSEVRAEQRSFVEAIADVLGQRLGSG